MMRVHRPWKLDTRRQENVLQTLNNGSPWTSSTLWPASFLLTLLTRYVFYSHFTHGVRACEGTTRWVCRTERRKGNYAVDSANQI